jgi:hypothetical protein
VLCKLEEFLKICSHLIIGSAMWIGKDDTGSFHDQFEVLFEMEDMI